MTIEAYNFHQLCEAAGCSASRAREILAEKRIAAAGFWHGAYCYDLAALEAVRAELGMVTGRPATRPAKSNVVDGGGRG